MFLQIPFIQSNLYITEDHLGVAYPGPQQQSFYLMIPLYEINKASVMDLGGPEVFDSGLTDGMSGSIYGQQLLGRW